MYPYNQQLSQLMLQQAIPQATKQEVIKVNGKNGANAFQLAPDTYYELSIAEMEHVSMLHEDAKNIIDEYKKNNEVPEAMQVLYEYLHERQVKWASKIRTKQERFK